MQINLTSIPKLTNYTQMVRKSKGTSSQIISAVLPFFKFYFMFHRSFDFTNEVLSSRNFRDVKSVPR